MFANLWAAYALWAVLGLFGAHRFYVGRPASGLVWMLTGGLFGIGWIIDFFLLPDFVCVLPRRGSRPGESAQRTAGARPESPLTRRDPLPHSTRPTRSEEHNKRVFHQQMVETGSTLLYNGEYGGGGGGVGGGGNSAYYTDGGQQQFGAVAPYAQASYYPQQGGFAQQQRGYGRQSGY